METLNLDFLRSASSAGYGPTFRNDRFSVAVVQFSGSFRSLSVQLEGRTNVSGGPWEVIAGWVMSNPSVRLTTVKEEGIYEYPIDGIVEFRFRILQIRGGEVDALGVLYDSADDSVYPVPPVGETLTFGNPNLFVKGLAEQIFYDPSTGNIIGYDKTATTGSISITANLAEVSGGMGNRLLNVLPDTVRISGTYTSAAFSLETRERIMGGEIAYDAAAQTCETITADSEILKVSKTPARSLAENPEDTAYWCYVRPAEAKTASGTNVKVDPVSGEVLNFVAEEGKRYEVTYFTHNISVQMLPIPSLWNPVMMTVQERYGVYAKQNGSAEKGILRGWLYFVVPRAILNADAGADASQTGTATTGGSWVALPEKPENMPFCDCDDTVHPIAYYVYVPCSGENDAVVNVVSVGNGLVLRAGRSKILPIKLVMPDDTLIQPDYATLNYMSEDDSIATVDWNGVVTGVSEGETVVHSYITKSDGSTLDCRTAVVVEGTLTILQPNPGNIQVG